MNIFWNPQVCCGCRTCEIACSFHHGTVFSPELSSIKVENDFRKGAIKWSIDASCDFCESEKEPLCMKYCLYGTLKGGDVG